MKRLLAVFATLGTMLTITRPGYAEGPQEICDTVTIETAGEFKIKHSKIKGIATTHNRGGIAAFVELWPPPRESNQILELTVFASKQKVATADCNVRRPGVMSCARSIRGLEGLWVSVNFKLERVTEYQQKMDNILDYLTSDVFNCDSSENRANLNDFLNWVFQKIDKESLDGTQTQ